MTTSACPIPATRAAQPPPVPLKAGSTTSHPPLGSWRYNYPHRSRLRVTAAIAISVAIHCGLFFGLKGRKKPAPKPADDHLIAVTFVIPPLKDLDEPDPVSKDDQAAKPDLGEPAPMLADLPQIPTPTDFVQQIDFSTLVERPDINAVKVWTIPENIRRGTKPGDGGGNIFNLADLDRIPEPVMQPAPIYPPTLKREGLTSKVTVEFIVDTQGQVQNAIVINSTHPGFDEAAMTGVGKWRFRAGLKGGVKVNTRMRVPIIFRVADDE